MKNVVYKLFSMRLFLFITPYIFLFFCAHHQERQIVSIQPLVTVILFLFITLYMFRAHRAHHQERQIVSIHRKEFVHHVGHLPRNTNRRLHSACRFILYGPLADVVPVRLQNMSLYGVLMLVTYIALRHVS
jgi:hypothetical protein